MDSTPSKPQTSAASATSERVGPFLSSHVHTVTGVRLDGRWYHAVRLVWAALALFTVGLFIAGVAAEFAQVRTLCPTASCRDGALTPDILRELHRVGISASHYAALLRTLDALGLNIGFYIGFQVVVQIIFAIVYGGVAVVLFWRGSDRIIALFASAALLIFGLATFPDIMSALAQENATWWLPVALVSLLGSAAFGLFFYLFPDGRFVPLWTLWVAIAWTVWLIPHYLFPGSFLDERIWPGALSLVAWLAFFGTVLYAQHYRYTRVSTPAQQQQTKWVVLGLSVALIGYYAAALVSFIVLPPTATPTPAATLVTMIVLVAAYAFMLLIPVSIAIAILRYHLFDIDVIIRRTLIYSLVTGALGAIYAIIGIVLQAAFEAVTQQASALAIVGSTLVIAALFQPVRSRVQVVVDQRFYRRKYDAALTLQTFGQTLHGELDVAQLNQKLLSVVQQTMQPSQVSLWLVRQAPTGEPDDWRSMAVWGDAAHAHVPKLGPLPRLFAMPEESTT